MDFTIKKMVKRKNMYFIIPELYINILFNMEFWSLEEEEYRFILKYIWIMKLNRQWEEGGM